MYYTSFVIIFFYNAVYTKKKNTEIKSEKNMNMRLVAMLCFFLDNENVGAKYNTQLFLNYDLNLIS
jgi:hypothetical protein